MRWADRASSWWKSQQETARRERVEHYHGLRFKHAHRVTDDVHTHTGSFTAAPRGKPSVTLAEREVLVRRRRVKVASAGVALVLGLIAVGVADNFTPSNSGGGYVPRTTTSGGYAPSSSGGGYVPSTGTSTTGGGYIPSTNTFGGGRVTCADMGGPLGVGDSGYAPHLDRDGDGIACE